MNRLTLKSAFQLLVVMLLGSILIVGCGSQSEPVEEETESAAESSATEPVSEVDEGDADSAEADPPSEPTEESTESAAPEPTAEPAMETRSRLVVGIPFMGEILDAQQAFDGSAMTTGLLGQPLLRIDATSGDLVPDLAESWSFSDDGKTMTFILPEGAVYSNGDPLDAQAVGEAFMRYKAISPYASDLEPLIEYNAVDATTLELIFSDPPAALLTTLNSAFGSPWNVAAAAEMGDEAFAVAPVASGPLLVAEFNAGSDLLLTRNDNFQTTLPFVDNQGPIHLEEVLVRAIPEDVTLAGELEAGTVDMIVPAPVSAIDRLRDNPDITVWETRNTGFTGLVLNQNHPFFTDLPVRRAIASAIDRDALVKVVNGVVPVHTFVTEGMIAYSPEAEAYGQELYPFDVAAAQSLLDEAGWSDGDGDGIVEKDGEPFAVSLLVDAGNVAEQQAAQLLQLQLGEIGIDLQIEQQDSGAIWDTKGAGEFDIAFDGSLWGDPDILSLMFAAEFWNYGRYDNPAVVEEMATARTLLDVGERADAYLTIQQMLLDDVAGIPLWQGMRYIAARNTVEGLIVNGFPIFLNDVMISEP